LLLMVFEMLTVTDFLIALKTVSRRFAAGGLGVGAVSSAGLVVGLIQPARACLGNPVQNLAIYSNSCPEFDYNIDNTVILKYDDAKLNGSVSPPRAGAQYFQFGLFNSASGGAAPGAPVTLTNLGWSRSVDPASFTTFQSSFVSGSGTGSLPGYNYTPIVSVPGPGPLGSPFYLRYTIPAGSTVQDDVIASSFLFNNNSATVPAPSNTTVNGLPGGQILETRALISGGELTRDNVAAVPAPLPVLGVGTLAAGALRLRRRLRQRLPVA
jgi:hypothetical protein